MKGTITHKILKRHLVEGELRQGAEIGIRIDQTLTQDATGTMAYLQLEALGIDRVRTELSVSYVDHNTLQGSFENADDHRYLQSVAARYGIYFSRPGNGFATGPPRTVRRSRQDAARSTATPHCRRPGHAGHRGWRPGCGRGHGGRPLPDRAGGPTCQPDRNPAPWVGPKI